MSSVQTSQLISLLINNVLMILMVMTVAIAAWLRWYWLQTASNVTRAIQRRCRCAYVSFVLTMATLLGMLTSLGVLTLRAMVAVNALVVGAMGIFLLSVITLLLALSLWFVDLCRELPTLQVIRIRRVRHRDWLRGLPVGLMPASMAVGMRRSKRAQRRQRR